MEMYIFHEMRERSPAPLSTRFSVLGFMLEKTKWVSNKKTLSTRNVLVHLYVLVHKIQLPYINHTITTPLATLFIYFLAQLFS